MATMVIEPAHLAQLELSGAGAGAPKTLLNVPSNQRYEITYISFANVGVNEQVIRIFLGGVGADKANIFKSGIEVAANRDTIFELGRNPWILMPGTNLRAYVLDNNDVESNIIVNIMGIKETIS